MPRWLRQGRNRSKWLGFLPFDESGSMLISGSHREMPMLAALTSSSAPLLVPLIVCLVYAGLVLYRGLRGRRSNDRR